MVADWLANVAWLLWETLGWDCLLFSVNYNEVVLPPIEAAVGFEQAWI